MVFAADLRAASGSPVFSAIAPGCESGFGEIVEHFFGGNLALGPSIPVDDEFFAAEFCGPETFGDDGYAGGDLLDGFYARDFQGFGGVEADYFAAEDRRARDDGGEHSGKLNVQAELRGAVYFGGSVEAARGFAD